MDFGIAGKRAVVTGSTAGIGLATASALAREGARVVVNGRTDARVREAMAAVRAAAPGADVDGVAADLATAAGCDALIARVPDADILVNNLGIFEPKPFEADPGRGLAALLRGQRAERRPPGAPLCGRHARAQLGPDRVHVERVGAADPDRDDPLRHDEDRAARGRARAGRDARRHRVTVNSVLPGPTASEGVGAFVAELAAAQGTDTATVEREFFASARPTSILQRFATPDEVAAMSPTSAARWRPRRPARRCAWTAASSGRSP